VTVPFCVVECGDEIPAESDQCFLAAGLVVVFHRIGEPYPFGVDFIGIRGSSKAPTIPSDVENDLRPCHIPALSTLEYIFNMIPEASHISSYPFQLVFEIAPMDVLSFNALVETLPERMGSLNIGYVNGALLVKRHAGVIRQDLLKFDGTIDTTNYLLAENGGTLRPGVLLESRSSQTDGYRDVVAWTNSGVKISRRDETCFTVSSHGWEHVNDKTVYHAGQRVGMLQMCVDGMATIEAPFSNEFLDLRCTAQKLYHSSLLTFGMFVVIDSTFTGRQRMFFAGIRAGPKRPKTGPGGTYVGPSSNYRYLQLEQGIYAVRSHVINGDPKIREGTCGTPVVVQGKPEQDESLLSSGLVCGFMSRNDVTGYSNDGRLFCYCQTVDPLIEEGWEVQNEVLIDD
jgi:hypothetical protein